MSQGFELYLDDILEAIRRVELYTGGKSYEEFAEDILVQDGVLRNLANLGEAVKRLPAELTDLQPQIEWRKIAGLRDILVHAPRHDGRVRFHARLDRRVLHFWRCRVEAHAADGGLLLEGLVTLAPPRRRP